MGKPFNSGLLEMPLPLDNYYQLRTIVCRSSRYQENDGGYRWWRTYAAIYGDFVEVQPSQGGDTPAAMVNCNWFGARLRFAKWVYSQYIRVKQYSCNWVKQDQVVRKPDHGFGLKDPMPYGQINEWVFSYDGRYVTRWIMGLWWRVKGRRTLWRLVTMTFWELTKL